MCKPFDFINRETTRLSLFSLLTHKHFFTLHNHPALASALDHSQFALCKTKANKPVGGERGEEHGCAPTSNIMTGRPSK